MKNRKESTKKKFPEILKEVIVDIQKNYKAKGRISRREADTISIYWNAYMNNFNN